LPHARGSSYGHSRLSKISHRKPYCGDLMPEAIKIWRELEKELGMTLLM